MFQKEKRMKNLIARIKSEASVLQGKREEEILFLIDKIKKRSEKGESLDNLLVEWFALVQEVSFRKLGLKHFDTQLLAGYYLHQGKAVEMKTGEGKTLASTLSISLNALEKKGVHVITVNDYLAERDQKWMGKLYAALGLSSGLIKETSGFFQKKESYNSDITYLTNSNIVFDYLRDNSVFSSEEILQRPFHYCLIDEIDSIFIDEARTPLILSAPDEKMDEDKLYLADFVAKILLVEKDFEINEKKKEISFTEEGYEKARKYLGKNDLYDPVDSWILELLNSLRANYLYQKDKDYIVLKDKVIIIDEFSGRKMDDRRWNSGLHEAIEVKEAVPINLGTKATLSITYQNFFPLYPKISGMTGTGKSAEKEFQEIYNLKVVPIETEKPMIRKDFSDLVYPNELAKWNAVLETTKQCFEKGQPLLIGTSSIEKSEFLSDFLSSFPHQVLNAKPENVVRENEIIAQAGKFQAITIATNMAGRGTDIILGGNPKFLAKEKLEEFLLKKEDVEYQKFPRFHELKNQILNEYSEEKDFSLLLEEIKNLPFSLETSFFSLKELYNLFFEKISPFWEKENKKVKNVGGLFVLGTERNENRRIDDQLRGRSGRQGDPGLSQFYLSLEDNLIKIFGGERLQKLFGFLGEEENEPLESKFLTQSIEKAQKKVEAYNYEQRKNIFQYDEVINIQRKKFFLIRKEFLKEKGFQRFLFKTGESFLDDSLSEKKRGKKLGKKLKFFQNDADPYCFYEKKKKVAKNSFLYKEIRVGLNLKCDDLYSFEFIREKKAVQFLQILDSFWTYHIENMNQIRETIYLRAYGQEDPLVEYNLQAYQSFSEGLQNCRLNLLYCFLENN
jgi:preprotein translocase subunit SecA